MSNVKEIKKCTCYGCGKESKRVYNITLKKWHERLNVLVVVKALGGIIFKKVNISVDTH